MAEKNPFDLDEHPPADGPERPHPARVYTAEEEANKLTGYLEIDPEFWDQIRYGTHMRYYTKKEGYRPGGFVLKNPFDTKPRGGTTEKRFIKLQNGFSDKAKDYHQWIVAYEDIQKIYIKPDAGVLMTLKSLAATTTKLNGNIRSLADFSKKLEARLKAVETRK